MIIFTAAAFLALSTIAESKEVVNKTKTRKKMTIEKVGYVKPKKQSLAANDSSPFKFDLMLDGNFIASDLNAEYEYLYPLSLGFRTSYTFFDWLTLGIGENLSQDPLGI